MQHFEKRKRLNAGFATLAGLSQTHNIPADVIALRVINNRRPEIEKYVQAAGLTPDPNPATLAMQATLIHEKRIKDKMEKYNINDYTLAENAVLAEDQQSFDGSGANGFNDFAPALLAVIGAVGKKAIEAVNNKRTADGKKPILSGKFWQFLKNKTENVSIDTNGDQLVIGIDGKPRRQTQSELAIGLAAARAELEAQAQKDYIKRKLPIIILSLVVLIFGIWYFVKHKK